MGQAAQTFNINSPLRQCGDDGLPKSKWKLYDEKFIMPPSLDKNRYDDRKPLEWMQSLRNYVAGKTSTRC